MGACFECFTITRNASNDEVIDEFDDYSATDRRENGNMYSGGLGMKDDLHFPCDDAFPDQDSAEMWLSDNNEKCGPAHAVQFMHGGEIHWMVGGVCAS